MARSSFQLAVIATAQDQDRNIDEQIEHLDRLICARRKLAAAEKVRDAYISGHIRRLAEFSRTVEQARAEFEAIAQVRP